MMYKGINHLAFATADMDMTIRYWRDLLGMRLVAAIGDGRYRHYFFELSSTDMVAFFEWQDVETIDEKDHGVPVKGPFAFDHVSFGIETNDDLWELKDKLEVAGFWVSEVMDHGFIRSIYTFDPNNIPIEFSVDVKGMDIRKFPQIKDNHPSLTAREGPDPVAGYWPKVKRPTKETNREIFPGEGLALTRLNNGCKNNLQ